MSKFAVMRVISYDRASCPLLLSSIQRLWLPTVSQPALLFGLCCSIVLVL